MYWMKQEMCPDVNRTFAFYFELKDEIRERGKKRN